MANNSGQLSQLEWDTQLFNLVAAQSGPVKNSQVDTQINATNTSMLEFIQDTSLNTAGSLTYAIQDVAP